MKGIPLCCREEFSIDFGSEKSTIPPLLIHNNKNMLPLQTLCELDVHSNRLRLFLPLRQRSTSEMAASAPSREAAARRLPFLMSTFV